MIGWRNCASPLRWGTSFRHSNLGIQLRQFEGGSKGSPFLLSEMYEPVLSEGAADHL